MKSEQHLAPHGARESGSELHVWDASETRAPLSVIEEDVVSLLRELSEAKLAVEESKRAGAHGQKRLLLGIAEALDGMQRVLKQVDAKKADGAVFEPTVKAWLGNFRTCSKLLKRVLADHQVTEFVAGTSFDPLEHRVLETRFVPNLAAGAIVETTLPGYRWRGELLRQAEVIVARESASDGDSAPLNPD